MILMTKLVLWYVTDLSVVNQFPCFFQPTVILLYFTLIWFHLCCCRVGWIYKTNLSTVWLSSKLDSMPESKCKLFDMHPSPHQSRSSSALLNVMGTVDSYTSGYFFRHPGIHTNCRIVISEVLTNWFILACPPSHLLACLLSHLLVLSLSYSYVISFVFIVWGTSLLLLSV